jgi:hypothetical protein
VEEAGKEDREVVARAICIEPHTNALTALSKLENFTSVDLLYCGK